MSKGTKPRHVRVPDDLWDAAVAKAADEGTSASAVIVAALRRYVTRPPRKSQG